MTTVTEFIAEAKTQSQKCAVLLLAHGTPEMLEEIPEYLKNVVSGRPLPQSVIEEIQHRYAQIGRSPLTDLTLQQAKLLQQTLGIPVYVGMRNWKPYISDTVRKMRADGVTKAVAICLAPQNSRTSVGLYRRAVYAEAGDALHLSFIDSWADHPRLVDAFAERLRMVWTKACYDLNAKIPVLFTAHSVPCRTIQEQQPVTNIGNAPSAMADRPQHPPTHGSVRPTLPERSYTLPANAPQGPDPYAVESKRTAALVAARFASDGLTSRDWFFAFQSQGVSGGPWLGPTVEETLQAIRNEGHAGVVLHPVGFLCDHVEILYDIDICFQRLAHKIGLRLWRTESLNTSPLLIEALADLSHTGFLKLSVSTSA